MVSLVQIILLTSVCLLTTVAANTTLSTIHGGVKIYDCFTFNGEWDMLQIRILTTSAMVEKYLVCESDHSFSGAPKPKYLELALASGEYPWLNQVAHKFIVRGLTAISQNSWENEDNTRMLWKDMLYTLSEYNNVSDRDWVFLSDVDEIWKPQLALEVLSPHFLESTIHFPCEIHYYNYATKHSNPMFGIVTGYRWSHYHALPHSGFREAKGTKLTDHRSGCWHCSYCFGPTLDDAVTIVRNKLQTFSHREYSGAPWTDTNHISSHIMARVDLFDRGEHFQVLTDQDIDAPLIIYTVPQLRYLIKGFQNI